MDGCRLVVRGRLAPLLELGAGFHFDLTGRENVFLNAALLGYPRRRVEHHFDEVVQFSELQAFIDVPVRNYSSGMLTRLGFSVATMFRPDILLIDEVLAVGDSSFQEKCLERIHDFRARGTTIVLVSHQTDDIVEHCDRALWLDHGSMAALGDTREVVGRYLEALTTPENRNL
jgi:lipopolysaccharide transport system ATP-binding protein